MHRFFRTVTVLALSVVITACGGGGGGGGGSAPEPTPGTPMATDPVALVSKATPVGGVIPNGAALNVTAKYHGPASAGELMEFSVNFAALTYTWRVVQSSYGVEQQSQSGTLSLNPKGGGYLMSSGGTLLITNTGSLFASGFALTIGGRDIPQAMVAQPVTGKAVALADFVGTFTFGMFDHAPTARFPFYADNATVYWGEARIDASGAVEMCVNGRLTNCVNLKRRIVSVNDASCPEGTAAMREGETFIGCIIKSSYGTGSVLSLDMQASPATLPGVAFFVQQAAHAYVPASGTYTSVTVANLSTDVTGCLERPIVVSDLSAVVECGAPDAPTKETATLRTMLPLPPQVIGMTTETSLVAMLLPLADGMWFLVEPTLGWQSTDDQAAGDIHVLVRN